METSLYRFSSNESLIYELRPNASYNENGVEYVVDMNGRRIGPSNSKEKENVKSLAFIGDSMTFPIGVAFEDGCLSRIQAELTGDYQILNVSIPRYDASQYVELMKSNLFKADLLIVVVNQGDVIKSNGLYSMNRFNYPTSPLSYLPGSWKWVIARLDGLIKKEPDYGLLEELLGEMSGLNIPTLVIHLPYCNNQEPDFHSILSSRCAAFNIPMVSAETSDHCLDEIHYSPDGHQQIYRDLLPKILNFIDNNVG